MKSNRSGFTLIELLVVVLIIGILVAMALSSYRVAVGTSRVATMYALVRSVDQAQQHFYMQTGRYASNLESLIIAMPAGFTKTRENFITNNTVTCQIVRDIEGGLLFVVMTRFGTLVQKNIILGSILYVGQDLMMSQPIEFVPIYQVWMLILMFGRPERLIISIKMKKFFCGDKGG